MNRFFGQRLNIFFGVAMGFLLGIGISAVREALALSAALLVFVLYILHKTRKSEQAELAEGKHFANLVQNSGDLIAMSSPDRKLRFLNSAGARILGIEDPKDFFGRTTEGLYPPETNDFLVSHVLPLVKKDGRWMGEINIRHTKTGEAIPVLMNIFLTRDINTNEVTGMATVCRDMRDMNNLKKQLDRFFEVSLDAMVIANTEGKILRFNPAFSGMLGFAPEELVGRSAMEFVHPEDVAGTLAQFELQAKGVPVNSYENRYRMKSGDYCWLSWKSYSDGEFAYAVARDITQEKARQSQMEKLRHDAVSAAAVKSEFLANMSHEIRTPINGVIGMTTLLLDTDLTTPQLEYAQNVKTSADSLLTVINDILDFSKMEAGKLEIENVEFSLDKVVEDTMKTLAWAANSKSLAFEVYSPRIERHLLQGDPGRIRQVLTNLISNAIKFTQAGGVYVSVDVSGRSQTHTKFKFSVKDTGVGIPPEAQGKIFSAFSQADASTTRKFGGSGLGLSISKQLVELMGGQIGVESEVGLGSTFWFTLTLSHSVKLSEKPTGTVSPLVRKSRFPQAQILVAEDNIINQKIILAMLDKLGLKAQAVANGNEVLAILHERPFDLIIMDCQMPELDGFQATKQIRETKGLKNDIPIIAMTANAFQSDRDRCLACGMSDYASKPVTLPMLADIIEKWLEKRFAA